MAACEIFLKEIDGRVRSITVDHYGSVYYIGQCLLYHYVDTQRVRDLVDLGYLVVLGISLSKPQPSDILALSDATSITDAGLFSNCIAYIRDRGYDAETHGHDVYENLNEALYKSQSSNIYCFDCADNQWYYLEQHSQWERLEVMLAQVKLYYASH